MRGGLFLVENAKKLCKENAERKANAAGGAGTWAGTVVIGCTPNGAAGTTARQVALELKELLSLPKMNGQQTQLWNLPFPT